VFPEFDQAVVLQEQTLPGKVSGHKLAEIGAPESTLLGRDSGAREDRCRSSRWGVRFRQPDDSTRTWLGVGECWNSFPISSLLGTFGPEQWLLPARR